MNEAKRAAVRELGLALERYASQRQQRAWDEFDLGRYLVAAQLRGLGEALQLWFRPNDDDDGGGGTRYRGRPFVTSTSNNREAN